MKIKVPENAIGLRLVKIVRGEQTRCLPVHFVDGRAAVETTLRRAAISGKVGPIGEEGDYWADFMVSRDDPWEWEGTVALDRRSWNVLKNKWMRCGLEP